MPVIETGVGNCHVYVDRDADLDRALAIVLNSKTHRPSVCNAAESLLVHADVAPVFVPAVVAALQEAGVTVHGDGAFARAATACCRPPPRTTRAEYLSLDISASVVPDLDAAVRHIRTYSSGHTEAIVTDSQEAARRFTAARGLRSGHRQRLDPVHRRRRVRLRRRDRHLHPEAARPRPDGAAGDDLDEVRRHRRRPAALARADPAHGHAPRSGGPGWPAGTGCSPRSGPTTSPRSPTRWWRCTPPTR